MPKNTSNPKEKISVNPKTAGGIFKLVEAMLNRFPKFCHVLDRVSEKCFGSQEDIPDVDQHFDRSHDQNVEPLSLEEFETIIAAQPNLSEAEKQALVQRLKPEDRKFVHS